MIVFFLKMFWHFPLIQKCIHLNCKWLNPNKSASRKQFDNSFTWAFYSVVQYVYLICIIQEVYRSIQVFICNTWCCFFLSCILCEWLFLYRTTYENSSLLGVHCFCLVFFLLWMVSVFVCVYFLKLLWLL